MIRRFRLRLTLVCTAMTGIVLIVLVLIIQLLTGREYRAGNEAAFSANVAQVTRYLLTQNTIDHAWLAQMETAGPIILSIEDQGVPLFFRGAVMPVTDRSVLIARARAQAASLPDGAGAEPFFIYGDAGDAYRCAAVDLETGEGSYSLIVLSPLDAQTAHLRTWKRLYGLVMLIGILLFSIISWVLSGFAARPVEKSLERQSAFVAAASHELRSPLAVISASAEAIRIDPPKTQAYISAITAECVRLGGLTRNLLTLTNAALQKGAPKRGEVLLDTLILEVTEQLSPTAAQHGFSLAAQLPGETQLPPVRGDEEQVRQALHNLILNAVEHAGAPGVVEVCGYCRGRRVYAEVIDHGKGIPSAYRSKVFDRFFQIDRARSDKSHYGLGLSIVRELVLRNGGRISLRPTVGGGCTFCISFPCRHS